MHAVLGTHVFRSSLRNFANNNASSLIKVSIACLLPILMHACKREGEHKNVWYSIANEKIRQVFSDVLDGLDWFRIEEVYFLPLPASLCEEEDSFDQFKQKFFKLKEEYLKTVYLDMKTQRMGKPSILGWKKISEIAKFSYDFSGEEPKIISTTGAQS